MRGGDVFARGLFGRVRVALANRVDDGAMLGGGGLGTSLDRVGGAAEQCQRVFEW